MQRREQKGRSVWRTGAPDSAGATTVRACRRFPSQGATRHGSKQTMQQIWPTPAETQEIVQHASSRHVQHASLRAPQHTKQHITQWRAARAASVRRAWRLAEN